MSDLTIVSVKTAARLYRLAAASGRIADIAFWFMVVYAILSFTLLIAMAAIPGISHLLHIIGYSHPENLPPDIFTDFSRATADGFFRALVALPILLVLWLRDRLLFPLRTGANIVFALVLSSIAIWWLVEFVSALRTGMTFFWSALAAINKQSSVLFGFLSNTAPGAQSNIGISVIQLMHYAILFSSFGALVALAARLTGHSQTSTTRSLIPLIASNARVPSSISIFFRGILELLIRSKSIFFTAFLVFAIAAALGSLIVINARINIPELSPVFAEFKNWVYTSALISIPYPPESSVNLLDVFPQTAMIGLLVFLIGVLLLFKSHRLLLILVFISGMMLVFWLLNLLPEHLRVWVYMLHGVPIALLDVSIMVSWGLGNVL